VFANPEATHLSARAIHSLQGLGVGLYPGLVLAELLDLHRPVVWLIPSLSGQLVAPGTRYGGCTSGHAITGLSTLQFPSLIATVNYFAGGILSASFLLPLMLK
jgi:uncharacterized protein